MTLLSSTCDAVCNSKLQWGFTRRPKPPVALLSSSRSLSTARACPRPVASQPTTPCDVRRANAAQVHASAAGQTASLVDQCTSWQTTQQVLQDHAADVSDIDCMRILSRLNKILAGTAELSPELRSDILATTLAWVRAAGRHVAAYDKRRVAGVMGALTAIAKRQVLALEGGQEVRAFAGHVLERSKELLPTFAPVEYSYTLTGAALVLPAEVSNDWLAELEVVSYAQLQYFPADCLTTTLWALHRIASLGGGGGGWRPNEAWMDVMLDQLLPNLPSIPSMDLAAMLSALAYFEVTPSKEWQECLYMVLQKRGGDLDAAEVDMLRFACERLNLPVTFAEDPTKRKLAPPGNLPADETSSM